MSWFHPDHLPYPRFLPRIPPQLILRNTRHFLRSFCHLLIDADSCFTYLFMVHLSPLFSIHHVLIWIHWLVFILYLLRSKKTFYSKSRSVIDCVVWFFEELPVSILWEFFFVIKAKQTIWNCFTSRVRAMSSLVYVWITVNVS